MDAGADYEYVSPISGASAFGGGLHGDRLNDPRPEYAARAIQHVSTIRPLNELGAPDPQGLIVVTSIGMSNTEDHFIGFIGQWELAGSPGAPTLVIIDGAQGGQDARQWDETEEPWTTFLNAIGPRVNQVQALWLMQAHRRPGIEGTGEFPGETLVLRDRLRRIGIRAFQELPNLKIIFLGNRMWAGYADPASQGGVSRRSFEPFAYETGFAARWLIEDQMAGNDPELNWDPLMGPVNAPLFLWAVDMWANGALPRSDGLVWLPEDYQDDFIHPLEFDLATNTTKGGAKGGQMLLDFFLTSPYTAWFGEPASVGSPILQLIAAGRLH